MRSCLLIFFSFALSCISLSAQVSYRSAETIEYIERFHKTAIREMYLYNIPASITLAQGILESGSGRSPLARSANNHFGIRSLSVTIPSSCCVPTMRTFSRYGLRTIRDGQRA